MKNHDAHRLGGTRRRGALFGVALLGVAVLGATAAAASTRPSSRSVAKVATPKRGGTVTDLVTAGVWPGLDPLTDTTPAADATEFNAIYGGLIEQGPKGSLIPDLATSWAWTDHNLALKVFLRHGVTFTDGSAFNAQVVAWNINRDLTPSFACHCLPNFADVTSTDAIGKYEIELHLSQPFSPLPSAFVNAAPGWIYSEQTLNAEGDQAFSQKPVGAGPFEVQSNVISSTLTLVRNPHYWEHGHPYLNSLVFQTEGSDQSAYDALEGGQGQMMGPSTISLIQTIKQGGQYQVVSQPPIAWEFVSLNQQAPPFNNPMAREAIIYATNQKQIADELYAGYFPLTEGPSASGQLFYQWKVPGYPAYDLTKAKQLVQQLGGLTVTLLTTSNTVFWQTEAEALQQQWLQAGITTNIDLTTLPALEVFLKNGNWQAVDSNWGNYADPALAIPNYFASTGPFTGSHDPTIDSLLAKGAASTNPTVRAKTYFALYAHMAQTATADFLYQKKTFTVASKQLQGLPTTEPYIYWENLWLK